MKYILGLLLVIMLGSCTSILSSKPGNLSSKGMDGAALVSQRCVSCHSTARILNRDADGQDKWVRTISKMRAFGAVVSDGEATAMADYLAGLHKSAGPAEIRAEGTFGRNLVWTVDELGRTVSAIDLNQGRVVGTIHGLRNPHSVIMSPDGDAILVVDPGGEEILMFSTADGALVRRIKAGHTPVHVLVSKDRRFLVAVNQNSNDVTVFNYATLEVIATVGVGDMPHAPWISPDSRYVYVPNHLSADVTVIDLQRMKTAATIKTDQVPMAAAGDPDNRFALISQFPRGELLKIDPTNFGIVGRASVPGLPAGMAMIPGRLCSKCKWAVSANQTANGVSFVDPETMQVMGNLGTGRYARGLAISPDGARLLVTNQEDYTVSVVDVATQQVVRTIQIGQGPNNLAGTNQGSAP